MDKYFFISYGKEHTDTLSLISKIKEDNWISSDTVIVNCSPDYSSRLSQMINHKLSYINSNELFEQVDLPMPYPTHSQIWNPIDKEYQLFDTFVTKWARQMNKSLPYLFVDSGTLRGKNFTKVKTAVRNYLSPEKYRFASLYIQDTSIFTPDYYVEKFSREKQGGLLFEWENSNNPNWDY